MKKHTILIFFLLLVIVSNSQNLVHIVSLSPDSALKNIRFSCLDVFDARLNNENIGHIRLGNYDAVARIEGDFTDHLRKTIFKLLPAENEKQGLIVIIRDLEVTEKQESMLELGFCRVEIEFAKKVDTSLYSLGVFEAYASDKGAGITPGHPRRILQCLEECFRKLDETNWELSKGMFIADINQKFKYDYKNLPPKGVYFSFQQMARGSVVDSVDLEIRQFNVSKKNPVYAIKVNKIDNPKQVQFVSDGENIYLRIDNYSFMKSRFYGKYIYFQGKLPSSMEDGMVFSFYLYSGFFGAALVASGSGSSMAGIVLETETGNVKGVTDYYIVNATKPYPEILKEYRASKRDLETKGNVIKQLNAKFD